MTEEERNEMMRSNWKAQMAMLGYGPDGMALPQNETSGWISVKERLPENVGEYLIAGPRTVTTGWYNGSEWTSMVAVTYRDDYVTHWMPLPEPPET